MPLDGFTDSSRKQLVAMMEAAYGVAPAIAAKNVSDASNAAPIVVTTATAHGLKTGNWVDIASVGGNTNANGNWQINVLTATTFELLGSQGNSAYTSGGTSTPSAVIMNFTEETLRHSPTKMRSKTVRSDGQSNASRQVNVSADGSIKQHLQYKESDRLLSMLLRNTWDVFGHRGVGAAFTGTTSSGTTLTASSATSGASLFTKLKKGQWVLLTGLSTAGNNGLRQISKSTAPTSTVLVFEDLAPGVPAFGTNGSMGASCRVSGARLTNGVLKQSMVIERQFTDAGQILPFSGMAVDTGDISFDLGDILNLNFGLKGKSAGAMVGSTTLPSPTAAQVYDEVDAVTGLTRLQRDGVTLTESLAKMALSIKNNLRPQGAIANMGPVGMGLGNFDLGGSMEAYMQDGTRFNIFIANTPFATVIAALDSSLNGYIITIPRSRYDDDNPSGGGMNADVTQPGQFSSEWDSSQTVGSGYDKTIFIDRVGVAT